MRENGGAVCQLWKKNPQFFSQESNNFTLPLILRVKSNL
jgi:hypothetical protein